MKSKPGVQYKYRDKVRPFFSVVIPTYNRAGELKRAIESVLDQSFTDFELLIMDDGSTDNTAEVVASFNDQRVIYEWDINFGGPARPRNRGVARAQGEWICFLDADDWWMTNKLEVCFENLNEKVDLVYHDLSIVRDHLTFFRSKKLVSRQVVKPVLVDLLVNGNAVANSSAVVRKSLLDRIGGIDENVEMIACEDYNTWLRIAEVTDSFHYLPQVLGYYNVHMGSISQRDMSLPLRCAVSKYRELLSDDQINSFNCLAAYISAKHHYRNGEFDISANKLKYCIRHASANLRLRSVYSLVLILFKRGWSSI